MLITSPIFGAQNTPLQVRTFTTLAISGALTLAIGPKMGPPPSDLFGLGAAVLQEVVAGILLGSLVNLALTAGQMAGAIMDIQSGLGMSQELNPVTGVPVTILSQFKFMLATVLFLSLNGHHLMLLAFARSYSFLPNFTPQALNHAFLPMLSAICLLAVQIATPVLGAGMIADAALALVAKAVPQMPAMLVGGPAKQALGLAAVALSLPALTVAVSSGCQLAISTFAHLFRAG